MINDVTVGAVERERERERESYTLTEKSEAFLGCIGILDAVYVKLNNIINKDSINLHYNCAF